MTPWRHWDILAHKMAGLVVSMLNVYGHVLVNSDRVRLPVSDEWVSMR